jgi:hypothetical protein
MLFSCYTLLCLQMPFNKPVKHMMAATKKGPQWKDGNAPAVQRPVDASKKFIVKIQAPMGGVSACCCCAA